LGNWDHCLFWVTKWGVWKSSENLHLYYKFRNSNQDYFYLDQKPGLVAFKHERQDIISFLYLFILFGWDVYLLTNNPNNKIMISHDEYIILSTDSKMNEIADKIKESGLRIF